MKEYLKMSDCFNVGMPDVKTRLFYAEHAINAHDELVAEVERLRGMVIRMQTYLDMAGEHPEKESNNPVRQWLFDAIDCTN